MSTPVTSVNRYCVKTDAVDEFLEIIDHHWTILREADLVTDRDVQVYVGPERESGEPVVVEIFEWVDGDASRRAHTHPAVSPVWESMGPLCEARGSRGPFEFLNLQRRDP